MHPVRETSFVIADKTWFSKSRGVTESGELENVRASGNSLFYSVLLAKRQHPKLWAREGHVLPEFGVQISKFYYRREHTPHDFDYYLDIVRVAQQGERWVVRDLYLDVLAFDGVRAKILDTDDYLAALREGHLDAEEAAYALLKLHALVDGLGACGYDLGRYLAAQGVTLTWRR